MEITVAKHAGFCFGVKRATDRLERAIAEKRQGERIYTLGTLIHNDIYNQMLAEQGVRVIAIEQVEAMAKEASENAPVTVFVRAHGIPREDEALLRRLVEQYPSFRYEDCTCPFVKKIHNVAAEHGGEDRFLVLCGSASHPECIGILSYFDGETMAFAKAEELERAIADGKFDFLRNKTPILVAQTTQNLLEWKKSQKLLQNLYTNALIFDTICSVTEERQTEAAALSSASDLMIVIGGRESSNTAKLFDICRENCPQCIWIERPDELADHNLITSAHTRVGIAAGASTPSGVIWEVWKTMSEMKENFEQMLEESFKTLNTGDIVTGTVTSVSDTELQLDIGSNVTGYIKVEQISNDPSIKLTEMYKIGENW